MFLAVFTHVANEARRATSVFIKQLRREIQLNVCGRKAADAYLYIKARTRQFQTCKIPSPRAFFSVVCLVGCAFIAEQKSDTFFFAAAAFIDPQLELCCALTETLQSISGCCSAAVKSPFLPSA